jgi:hypothetical protein
VVFPEDSAQVEGEPSQDEVATLAPVGPQIVRDKAGNNIEFINAPSATNQAPQIHPKPPNSSITTTHRPQTTPIVPALPEVVPDVENGAKSFENNQKDSQDDLGDLPDDSEPPGRPKRLRFESAYIKRLRSGETTVSGRSGDPILPKGVQPGSGNASLAAEGVSSSLSSGFAFATKSADLEPRTIEEARRSPKAVEWELAARLQIQKLKENKTWYLIPPNQARSRPIPSRWVFNVKRDGDSVVTEYKGRVVACGNFQQFGTNFTETHSPVANEVTIRVLLAMANHFNWEIRQADFKSAYLNGKLDEEIYMEQPPGFAEPGKEDYVCRLLKSIYGLRQAGRVWYDALCKLLYSLGFKRASYDHALFTRIQGESIIFLGIHVDDELMVGNKKTDLIALEKTINNQFSLKILGDAKYYLGLTIKRDRDKGLISLGQASYIDEAVIRFGLEDAKAASTPLPPGIKLGRELCPSDADEIKQMAKVPYRELIGLLLWIARGTRPDISYAVNMLCQVLDNPGRIHWECAKRVVRYLKGTRDYRLTYGHTRDGLIGFSDSNFASPDLGYKSLSGFAFLFDGGAISWSAKKQPIVTLSTAEAEYVALTHAARELVWIRNLISELLQPFKLPTILFADNRSSILIAQSPNTFHPRTKHIALRFHYIRDVVSSKVISLVWIDTHSNIADLFTKSLEVSKTQSFAFGLGLST